MKKLISALLVMSLISCGETQSNHTTEAKFKQYYGQINFNNPATNNGIRTECISTNNEVLACDIFAPIYGGKNGAINLVDEVAKVVAAFNDQPDHSKLIADSASAIDQAFADKEMKSMNLFGKQTYVSVEVKNNNVYVGITN